MSGGTSSTCSKCRPSRLGISGFVCLTPQGLLTFDGGGGSAYEGSNRNPKIWVLKTVFLKFWSMMMPISQPKIWVPNFVFKIRIPSTLAQNVLHKFRNDFKPNQYTLSRDLEQQNPTKWESVKKFSPKTWEILR